MASELTDEHIALLESALDKIENEYRPTCIQSSYGNGCAGAVDADVDFWRRAVDCVPALLSELRARRAREKVLVGALGRALGLAERLAGLECDSAAEDEVAQLRTILEAK